MQKLSPDGGVLGLSLFVLLFLFPMTELHAQFPVVSGSWTATSPLPVSLRGYTLTLLQSSGELLLTGGVSFGGTALPNFANTAFIYNPLSHAFRTTAHPMNVARAEHTATPLPDETVLITGGLTPQGFTNSAELYDPLTDSFSTVGSMSVARAEHSATLVDSIRIIDKDGLPNWAPTPLRVLIAGGTGTGSNALNSLEYYDFYTRRFNAVSVTLTSARHSHTATWLPTVDLILIAGGSVSTNGPTLGTAELYDPANERILTTRPMVSPRVSHTATLLKDGSVLLTGGFDGGTMLDTAEIFSESSLVFSGTPGKMAFPQARHAAALMGDGTVLLAGGDGNGVSPPTPTASAQIFHPITHLFSVVPHMLTARTDFEMGIALNTDEVLAAGGASFAGGGEFEVGLSASEVFVPRGPRQLKFIDLNFCTVHPIACQFIHHRSPLILSGMVHHTMLIAPFPETKQELPRDRKTPVSYKIVISGLADGWDAAVVNEDGMPLGTAEGKSGEPQVVALTFKDASSFEAAQESSLLVFQMTSKAAIGKEYPISVKTELTPRPDLIPGQTKSK